MVDETMDEEHELAVEPEDTFPLDRIKEPFNPKDVEISQKSFSIGYLLDRMATSPPQINLITNFQRGSNLWTYQQQSRLIESILIRLPLPVFYFDASDDNNWLVIDGLQRLSALRNFAVKKTLKLKGLEFLPQIENMGFDELPVDLQRRIQEATITAFLINPGTPSNVKFIIFQRINTGGTTLEPQEIRHALNAGRSADFIAELAEFEEFKKATARSLSPLRMLDRDFVNRFLAFYIIGFEHFEPDMNTFLNTAMIKLNELPDVELENIRINFKRAMVTAQAIFGDRAFRKWYSQGERRKPLNKALFDTWSVALAQLTAQEISILIDRKEVLYNEFLAILRSSEEFNEAISTGTGDKSRVNTRFKTITNLIKKVLSTP